jgi:hypothetical protein
MGTAMSAQEARQMASELTASALEKQAQLGIFSTQELERLQGVGRDDKSLYAGITLNADNLKNIPEITPEEVNRNHHNDNITNDMFKP